MLRKVFTTIIISFLFGMTTAIAQQEKSDSQASQHSTLTSFESFMKQTDAIIVTKAYPISELPPKGSGTKVTAMVAWVLGQTVKAYAVYFDGRIVDFDQLKNMQDGLDRFVQAVNGSFEKLSADSMSYSSPAGLSVSYYAYSTNDSSALKKNLYVKIGSYVYQSSDLEPLIEIRNQIAQAREKLISLGAK